MSLNKKIFGFKTKNLCLAEVKYKIHRYDDYGIRWYGLRSFNPKKYVLVRKKDKNNYVDIFTKTSYSTYYCDYTTEDNELVLSISYPVISNKRRIKYKDAEEILKTANTVLIKK